MRISFTFLFFFTALLLQAQKKVTITALPADAEIYRVYNSTSAQKLGVGTVVLELEKETSYLIEVRKSGYLPIQKVFERKKGGNPTEKIELTDRVVIINAAPSDAKIFQNGVEMAGTSVSVVIPRGQSTTVDIKKAGYVTQTKTYYNKDGQDEPELSHLFKLEDRVVAFSASPGDAEIFVDGKKKGEGNAQIIIPKNNCVNVVVQRSGYVQKEVEYCNKETEPAPPISDKIVLKDRKIMISTIPSDVKIVIEGKEVGKGSYGVVVPDGKCVEVFFIKPSFVTEKRDFCNKTNYDLNESSVSLKLKEDEAYEQSDENSIANQNFTIEVNPATSSTEAWKRLTSIIQSKFDEIETIDATSSYLRTNWVGRRYNEEADFPIVVRTRIIVTSSSTTPLRYNIKIQSETSKTRCVSKGSYPATNNDECFEPWPRILRKYNDVISECQRRLQ